MFDSLVMFLAENGWNLWGAVGTVIAVVDKLVAFYFKRADNKLCKECEKPKKHCQCTLGGDQH
ncbi:MAG: hypothetical protein GY833_12885 [Aestuariibacter sp.]|nr:hypothetical protein [Aestuariibacter sp.]